MRSSLFVVVLVASLAVASAIRVADADDQALMEIGVDLQHRVDPTPTYTTTRPDGHEDPLIAKFPMLHEIQGLEKQDWNDIQGLLFREPPSAAESNVDMKLDELEEKFNKLDTMPVPSSIAPKGSTLLPSLKKPELGLRATLPKSLAPRLQQVKAAPAPAAAAPKAAAPAPVAAKPTPAPAAAPAPVAAKPAAAAPAAAAKPAAAPAKPLTVDQEKAAEESKKKGEERVRNTVATVRLIEKRMKGLSNLIQRLKSQIGLTTTETQSSAQRLTAALQKHRKDKADLAKRMAARKTSLMEVDATHEQTAEAETETETESETETETGVDSDIAAVINTEVEGEQETETDAEAQLDADAEAVDSIIDTLL